MSLKNRILETIAEDPGLTDRLLADRILGQESPQQSINQAARALEKAGRLVRRDRPDSLIGNYPVQNAVLQEQRPRVVANTADGLSEDEVKGFIQSWLERDGWNVKVRWGREHGIDVEARSGKRRWIIEAKGCGSLPTMRVNYFISMLGETLQRMSDADAQYSIALPDMLQFRILWSRLPRLAKDRTTISLILVGRRGNIEHLQ